MTRRMASAIVVLAVALTIASAAEALPVQQAGCERMNDRGRCEVVVPVPVQGDQPSDGPGPGRGGGGGTPERRTGCVWQTVPPPPASSRAFYPGAPPDAVWQVLYCGEGSENSGQGYRWLPPGGAGVEFTPPSPAVLAQTLLASVRAEMHAPTLGTDPAIGVAAVVNAPVFVEVTNWQGQIVQGPECVFFVCVSMTATPTLSFDSGDGSAAIACDPPGSRYVPGGPPLLDQAQGACAHIYRLRTGAEGRPAAWPGVVSVTWDVSWTSSVAGAAGPSGTFDPLVFSTGLPRAVDEVATAVVDGES